MTPALGRRSKDYIARRSLIVSSTVAGAKLPFGNCRIETGLHDVDQGRVHAAVGGLGIGEIALLHREPPEIVARHGARLRSSVRTRKSASGCCGCGCGGCWCLDVLDAELAAALLRLRLLMRTAAGLRAAAAAALAGAAAADAAWLSLLACAFGTARGLEPAKLKLHQPVYRLELGLQILEPRIVLALELLDELVELCFMGVDLLFKQSWPGLAGPREYHALLAPRCMALAPTTERAGRFTQDRTNPAWPPRPASIQGLRLMPRPGGLSAAS